MTDAPNPNRSRNRAMDEITAPIRMILPDSTEGRIVMAILLVLALWGLAIFTYGFPALLVPMKVIVPLCVVMLIVITQGK
jgi:hypothetical protein